MSIKEPRSGSAERRCKSALSISPSADKGLMIWGKTLDDDFGVLFRRLLVDTGVAEDAVVCGVFEEGREESFRIFWGRIGILEGLEGFGGRSTGELDTRVESELGWGWGWGGVWVSGFACTWVCSPMSAK